MKYVCTANWEKRPHECEREDRKKSPPPSPLYINDTEISTQYFVNHRSAGEIKSERHTTYLSSKYQKAPKHKKVLLCRYLLFVNKIAQGIKSVDTPFSVLCADDDFLILSGLARCVDFLSSHSDFSSCQGRAILHQIKEDDFIWMPNGLKAVSITQENASQRFDSFFPDNYSGYPLYAVHRTGIHKRIWDEADRCVDDWGLSEIFPSCLSVIFGKMKILDCFYSSRETNIYNWVDTDAYQRIYSAEKVNKVLVSLTKHIDSEMVQEKFKQYFKLSKVKMSANLNAAKEKGFLRTYLGSVKENALRCQWLARIKNPGVFYKELKDIRRQVFAFKIDEDAVNKFRESYR